MKKLLIGSIAAALAVTTIATPAHAQFREYEDYQFSDSLIEMTTVRVDPGRFETYLEGLNSTWVAANNVARDLGHIQDYGIYVNQAPGAGDFHILLVIQFHGDMMQPSRERYDAFMNAWGRANQDRSNQTVINLYNEIREIQGTYLVREVEMVE